MTIHISISDTSSLQGTYKAGDIIVIDLTRMATKFFTPRHKNGSFHLATIISTEGQNLKIKYEEGSDKSHLDHESDLDLVTDEVAIVGTVSKKFLESVKASPYKNLPASICYASLAKYLVDPNPGYFLYKTIKQFPSHTDEFTP